MKNDCLKELGLKRCGLTEKDMEKVMKCDFIGKLRIELFVEEEQQERKKKKLLNVFLFRTTGIFGLIF